MSVTSDTVSAKSADATVQKRSRAALLRNGGSRFALVGVWILMIGLYTLLKPGEFFTTATFTSIFNSQQVLVFLTCSLLCTIIVGEFVDLSVPSVLEPRGDDRSGAGGPARLEHLAWLRRRDRRVPGCRGGSGCAGGLYGRQHDRGDARDEHLPVGIALWISSLNYVTGLSNSFAQIDLANVFGLPVSFYYGIAMMLVFAYILAFTPLGSTCALSAPTARSAGWQVSASTGSASAHS